MAVGRRLEKAAEATYIHPSAMGKKMKRNLRAAIRSFARVPIFGRFIRIAIHLYRLPEFREATIERQGKVDAVPLTIERLEALKANMAETEAISRVRTAKVHEWMQRFESHQPLTIKRLEALEANMAEAEAISQVRTAKVDELMQRFEKGRTENFAIVDRFQTFQSKQLPSLIQSISEISARQQASDKDKDNIVNSVPIALRRMQRELVQSRSAVDEVKAIAEQEAASLRAEHNELNKRHGGITDELGRLADTIDARDAAVRTELSGAREDFSRDIQRFAEELRESITSARRDEIEALQATLASRVIVINEAVEKVSSSLGDLRRRLTQSEAEYVTVSDLKAVAEKSDIVSEKLENSQQRISSLSTAFEDISSQTASIWQRIEFIRKEVMFEMRYGGSSAETNSSLEKVEPKIINKEKFEAAKTTGDLKLNLGCGHIAMPTHLNVDRRELPHVDVVADITNIPVEKGAAAEIFSSHLLEHFPQEQLRRELLPYWVGLLKSDGKFRAVVPDTEAMIQRYVEGDYPYEDFREVVYGSQDYDGDFHFNMFTPESLVALLKEAGLRNPEIIEKARRNGACYEFEIMVTK